MVTEVLLLHHIILFLFKKRKKKKKKPPTIKQCKRKGLKFPADTGSFALGKAHGLKVVSSRGLCSSCCILAQFKWRRGRCSAFGKEMESLQVNKDAHECSSVKMNSHFAREVEISGCCARIANFTASKFLQ